MLLAIAIVAVWSVVQPREPAPAATTPVASASASAAQTASAIAVAPVPLVVYFARDELPPLRSTALGSVPARNTIEDRIGARVSALWSSATPPPPDSFNAFKNAGRTGSSGSMSQSTRVDGDLATVTFGLPGGWGVSDALRSLGLYQQLVYTISEEPGIRRVLIKEEGKPSAVIGTITVSGPVTREDVLRYAATTETNVTSDGVEVAQEVAGIGVSIDGDPFGFMVGRQQVGVGRVGVQLRSPGAARVGSRPRFTASLERCDPPSCLGGNWTLSVILPNASWPAARPTYEQTFDRTPIRSVRAASFQGGTVTVAIRLDEALPWRVASEPQPDGSVLLFIDVGGHVSTTSDSVAIYNPTPDQGMGDRARGCSPCGVTGAARTPDGVVGWRVRDGAGHDVAHGTTAVSRASASAWGTFTALATVPPGLIGQVAIEVFTLIGGRESGLVSLPITLH